MILDEHQPDRWAGAAAFDDERRAGIRRDRTALGTGAAPHEIDVGGHLLRADSAAGALEQPAEPPKVLAAALGLARGSGHSGPRPGMSVEVHERRGLRLQVLDSARPG